MTDVVAERMHSAGTKEILACHGGGLLRLIYVEILAKLKAELRAKTRNPRLVLAHWFNFICGTSTGAISATCIAPPGCRPTRSRHSTSSADR